MISCKLTLTRSSQLVDKLKSFAKSENDECILNDLNYIKHADMVKEDYLHIYNGIHSKLNNVK